jgi:hypothetical protein
MEKRWFVHGFCRLDEKGFPGKPRYFWVFATVQDSRAKAYQQAMQSAW